MIPTFQYRDFKLSFRNPIFELDVCNHLCETNLSHSYTLLRLYVFYYTSELTLWKCVYIRRPILASIRQTLSYTLLTEYGERQDIAGEEIGDSGICDNNGERL